MKWRVTFYSQNVEQATLAFPAGILAHLLHIFEMIEEWGACPGQALYGPNGRRAL